jgi:hypothetical protein
VNSFRIRLIVGLLLAFGPSAANAELVTLRGGRVMSVASVTFDGDTATLTLRGGGEIGMPRVFVESVVPDEVPYVPPAPPESAVRSLVAVAPVSD